MQIDYRLSNDRCARLCRGSRSTMMLITNIPDHVTELADRMDTYECVGVVYGFERTETPAGYTGGRIEFAAAVNAKLGDIVEACADALCDIYESNVSIINQRDL